MKTLQQIYQKHAEQLRKINAEWEEKTGVLKAYIKTKDEECRDLTERNAKLHKDNQLMTAKIEEFEKLVAAKIEEIKNLKETHQTEFDKMKQDVLKTYARTKEEELRDTRQLLEDKIKEFNVEELRRQKGDAIYQKLTEEHHRLERRYASLQSGYDREMSSRERLESSMLEQERNLRTEL